ncbi:hypothetical protein SAMN05660841_01131 [Sphingobacterium nematocida]|uniref:Glycosyl hydrolases family 43 n=1 Tax=Sphingobacterium nematocida TaxID=1513896 RepID=A0A1T5C4Z9_9SPHI|nr:glycoside hydrolase family protein [Sphingobacterium nematocida]SKB54514.1 hypothetical protein SAMN05660841_01131 [Sphingobacterium nematocida]
MIKKIVFLSLIFMIMMDNVCHCQTNPFVGKVGPVKMDAGFSMDDYWVWCGSVIKGEDGLYHMFASRWPKKNPFHPSWMVSSEVVRASSRTLEGPYEFQEVVLPARGAQYWDGRATHNPSITKVGDEYVLFYMGSTHPFDDPNSPDQLTLTSAFATVGRANKRIGIATSKSIKGPWARRDTPVLPTKPNTFYSFLTSNPAPLVRKDGSVLVVFKGRRYGNTFPYQSTQKIGIAYAKSIHDPFVVLNDDLPLNFGSINSEFEDPFLWEDERGLHLLMKDMGSRVTGEHHAGVLFHSENGIDWVLDKQPKAYSRLLKFEDGTEKKMGQLERPFVYFEKGKPVCIFFATMDGPGGFEKGTTSWNIAVPVK